MPQEFYCRGTVSMVTLLVETGYHSAATLPRAKDYETYLRDHPELTESWQEYSEDQRCSPAWFIRSAGSRFEVGFYPAGESRFFIDRFAACGYFVQRFVEQLSTLPSTS